MSLVLADRVRQTSTSTGTGTITLDGTVVGYQSFSVIGNNNTTYYTITLGAQWEVGIGTYYGGTLSRDTVISSSTGSKLDLAAGTKDVFVTLPSSVAVTSGTDVAFTKVTTPTVQATNSAGLSLKNSSGTTQISMGAGGGDNLTLNVSTNINGANAQVDISPTGTGHVHMKPTGTGSVEIAPTNAGTLDNLVIGGITPKAITGTTVTATTFSGSGASLTSIPNSALNNSAITINGVSTSLGGSVSVGTVTSVTGTSPVVSSGGNTPAISMPAATTSVSGYLTSTDWNTFNGKSNTNGTVTSVAALTLGTTGTDLSSTVATGTTTPVITLNVPTASATNRGALSAADWTTFNNKGSGTVTSVTGTSPVASSGGATPAISLSSGYGDTQNPYASKTANYFLASPNGSAGAPTFRAVVAADIPTLNQNTTGSAGTLTTPRAIYGNNFDGSAALTQIIASTYGGTGNGFAKLSGPATTEKTFTLPNASATILTDNAAVTVLQGGTGSTTASGARTNLGAAASGANSDITSIALTTGTISTAPSGGTDIVNKTYADGLAAKWGT